MPWQLTIIHIYFLTSNLHRILSIMFNYLDIRCSCAMILLQKKNSSAAQVPYFWCFCFSIASAICCGISILHLEFFSLRFVLRVFPSTTLIDINPLQAPGSRVQARAYSTTALPKGRWWSMNVVTAGAGGQVGIAAATPVRAAPSRKLLSLSLFFAS